MMDFSNFLEHASLTYVRSTEEGPKEWGKPAGEIDRNSETQEVVEWWLMEAMWVIYRAKITIGPSIHL